MAGKCDSKTRINLLIYDYLKQACPNAAKIVVKELSLNLHHDKTLNRGISLQKILEFYDLHHNTQTEHVDTSAVGQRSSEASLTFCSSATYQLPKLPSLVMKLITDFLPCKKLQSLRLLSQEWNYLASEALRKRENIRVILNSTETVENFLATIATRIQEVPPFSHFEFNITEVFASKFAVCKKFVKVAGKFVHSYTFHVIYASFRCRQTFGKLIQNVSNLKFVTIITHNPAQDFLSCVASLPKLTCLALVPKLRRDATVQPNIELIRQWIKKCPKLTNFSCKFRISVDSTPDLPDFLHDMNHLKFVRLNVGVLLSVEVQPTLQNLIKSGGKIHQLKVSSIGIIFNDYSLLSEWINSLIGTLSKLSVTRDYNITGIQLPNCSTLEICTPIGLNFDTTKISSDQFPALKIVKIVLCHTKHAQFFERQKFQSVTELHVSNATEFDLESQNFDYIFPNLTTLRLENSAGPKVLEIIFKNFTHLEHLKFVHFKPSGFDKFDYWDAITGGMTQSEIKWDEDHNLIIRSEANPTQNSLGRLNRLKTLVIGGQHLEKVLFGMLCMTALREIPRLDSLTLVYTHWQQEHIARMGAKNFVQYGYHKQVSVKIIPQKLEEARFR